MVKLKKEKEIQGFMWVSRNLMASSERQTDSRKERQGILDYSFNVFQTLCSIGASLLFFVLSDHYYLYNFFAELKLDCSLP